MPFRSHTVQNGYGLFMSPAPEKALDGEIDQSQPDIIPLGEIIRNSLE